MPEIIPEQVNQEASENKENSAIKHLGAKSTLIIAAGGLVLVVILLIILVLGKPTVTDPLSQTPSTTQVEEIKSVEDLNRVERDLQNTNIDNLNSTLEENDTDASQF